ncbi:hypothetical protein [Caulobacter hibisci]|uniref:DUF4893 domain-containing protein n=1 Tax=Caulobacter hibisci TaxID=2035993 RepID=A0ABS0SXX9_9CAUL|nr:hypothetical protein [Caulobacter hibisci]MBI1684497.1 hypothetical protein [Caulobacter hibisci]
MVAALVSLMIAAAAPASDCIITESSARDSLRFDGHPARAWSGAPAKPMLDTPDKRLFRTALREGAAKGPNFAGHMTIVQWGCGTSCVAWAAVDARTGRVTKLAGADYMDTIHVGGLLHGVNFQRDSRLLVLAGAPREDMSREGVYRYLWTGKEFRKLDFIPRPQVCEPFDAP